MKRKANEIHNHHDNEQVVNNVHHGDYSLTGKRLKNNHQIILDATIASPMLVEKIRDVPSSLKYETIAKPIIKLMLKNEEGRQYYDFDYKKHGKYLINQLFGAYFRCRNNDLKRMAVKVFHILNLWSNEFIVKHLVLLQPELVYENASEELKWNREVMLLAILSSIHIIKNFPDEFKNDRELIMKAVKINGQIALKYASETLQNDREVVFAAVKNDGMSLEYSKIRNDKELELIAVNQNSSAFEFASELQNDRQFVLKFVKQYVWIFKYISRELKEDVEVVRLAIKQCGEVYQYLPLELRKNRKLALNVIRKSPFLLQYAPEEIRNDKEIVMKAIKRDLLFLKMASNQLRSDKVFILELFQKNSNVLSYASEELRSNVDFVLELIKKDARVIQYVSDKLLKDRQFILKAAKVNGEIIRYYYNSGSMFEVDREIALEAVKQNLSNYYHQKFRDDSEIVLEVLFRKDEHFDNLRD